MESPETEPQSPCQLSPIQITIQVQEVEIQEKKCVSLHDEIEVHGEEKCTDTDEIKLQKAGCKIAIRENECPPLMKVLDIHTAYSDSKPTPGKLHGADQDCPIPALVSARDTGYLTPILRRGHGTEKESQTPVPPTEPPEDKCPISVQEMNMECHTQMTNAIMAECLIVNVPETEIQHFSQNEVKCQPLMKSSAPVGQVMEDIIREVQNEKIIKSQTFEVQPIERMESDATAFLCLGKIAAMESEITDPESQPSSNSQTFETLVKVKDVLMDLFGGATSRTPRETGLEDYHSKPSDPESMFSSPEEHSVLDVNVENSLHNETENFLEMATKNALQLKTPSPKIRTLTLIGSDLGEIEPGIACMEPELENGTTEKSSGEILDLQDVGIGTDYFQMRNVETCITPGRFKPEMTEQETDMDIQMIDTASSTLDLDFEKLVEEVLNGACSDSFIEEDDLDLGKNLDINQTLAREIQFTDIAKASINKETDHAVEEPMASSSTVHVKTKTPKRKHSISFTRSDPRLYEENFDDSMLPPEHCIPKKKTLKENTAPVPCVNLSKSFTPRLRIGLSKRSRPRQPLHGNIVIKTYPDPVEEDSPNSDEEEEA